MQSKIINSLLMPILICGFSASCSKTKNDEELSHNNSMIIEDHLIPFDDIFSQVINSYAVLIYSPTCNACKSTIDVIEEKYKKCHFDIFFVPFSEVPNKKQGRNLGVDSIDSISVNSVPTLFIIFYNKIVGEFYGFNSIRNVDFENIIWE